MKTDKIGDLDFYISAELHRFRNRWFCLTLKTAALSRIHVNFFVLLAVSSKGELNQNLAVGDNVEVVEGDLMHLQGRILKIENGRVTMMPKHEDLKEPLEFPLRELAKSFKEGDHVKVISGTHEGDTGLIVRVDENVIILLSDLSRNEVGVE